MRRISMANTWGGRSMSVDAIYFGVVASLACAALLGWWYWYNAPHRDAQPQVAQVRDPRPVEHEATVDTSPSLLLETAPA